MDKGAKTVYENDDSVSVKQLPVIITAGKIVLSENPGELLRDFRRFNGVTRTRLAEYLKLDQANLKKYENGQRKTPGTKLVKRWIEAVQRIKDMGREVDVK